MFGSLGYLFDDVFVGTMVALACVAIGFPLVAFHNIWASNASLIITVLGWVALIKGLALLMFPLQTMKMYKGVLTGQNKAYIGYVVIALGIILLYFGYFA